MRGGRPAKGHAELGQEGTRAARAGVLASLITSADSGGRASCKPVQACVSPRLPVLPWPHWVHPRALPSILICSLVHSTPCCPLPRIGGTRHLDYTRLDTCSRSCMAAPLSCLDCVAPSHTIVHYSPGRPVRLCARACLPNIRFRRAENNLSGYGERLGWYTAYSVPHHPS